MRNLVLQELNKVYKEENPSIFVRDLNNKKKIQKLINNRKKFLLNLKLPPNFFNQVELLDLGCGSGQNSIVFDNLNAHCTLVEYDKKSIENAKNIFKKYGKNKYKFFNKDLFKFKIKKKFDVVVTNGVAHHTFSPIKNIDIACKFLKKGGFLIIGICTKEGWFQRNLQRAILFNISNSKEEIVVNAKKLFNEHLMRSKRYGMRNDRETIFDTYINPKVNCVTIEDIEKIFLKNKITMYSSLNYEKELYKYLNPSYAQFSHQKLDNQREKKGFNIARIHEFSLGRNIRKKEKFEKYFKNLFNRLNKVTDQFNDLNFKKKINLSDKNLNNLKKIFKKNEKISLFDQNYNVNFVKEIIDVLKILRLATDNLTKTKYLKDYLGKNKNIFKKFNGVGMNYFVGYKS